ncbi:MAG TPA: glycosyltransferase family 2 protein [Chthoniobacterales bacterium]
MNASEASISVLIPAFNEEGAIASTLHALAELRPQFADMQVIVINDGSTDRTGEIARSQGANVIEHQQNRGYGAALKAGLHRARFDFIVIADADGTYPLADIPKLVSEMSDHDMIVGARSGKIVQVPLLRRPGKWMITRLAMYLSHQHIPDLNSGLRVFRKDVALRFLPLYPDGFSFTTTITLAMLTNAYRVKFVPINYLTRIGKSSIHPVRDFMNFIILIIRICAFFKPLNVFTPPALTLLVLGLVKGTIDYTRQGHLGLLGVSMALTGLQMLFIGLLADLIDQRMKL